jgi:hypothetical protein
MLDFAFCSSCLSSRKCYHWNPLNVTHLKDVVTMHVDYGQQTYRVGGIMWEMAAFPQEVWINSLACSPQGTRFSSRQRACCVAAKGLSEEVHPWFIPDIKLISNSYHICHMLSPCHKSCPEMRVLRCPVPKAVKMLASLAAVQNLASAIAGEEVAEIVRMR